MKKVTDTIVAAATPKGRGGVSVIRVSGENVSVVAHQLLKKILKPRKATLASFFDVEDEVIDEGIALYFKAPHSFTGEDILELQGHGSPVVVDALIQRILSLGVRLARPGEFSERAFLNDKMDLLQAEAVADLIDASSVHAAKNAMRSLKGEFSEKIRSLVQIIIRLRMYIEAAIDFSEEEIDFLNNQQITNDLAYVMAEVKSIETIATQGSLLREGMTVVIAGVPNVGKSSLLNKLSGKDVAIVTEIPGTTRDILREHILLDHLPLHIIDTAGLRDSLDRVEQEGIRRAKEEILQADLILFVIDASHNEKIFLGDLLDKIPERIPILTVRNKIDLTKEPPCIAHQDNNTIISLSAKSGDGLDLLKKQIKCYAGMDETVEGVFSARRRHLEALKRAKEFLVQGQCQLRDHKAGELLAEDLKQAQNALNEITGEFTSDDLLGRIFSNFCIGK